METQPSGLEPGVVREAYRGNVLIRVHESKADDGTMRYMVVYVARNAWACQDKLITAYTGLAFEDAVALFDMSADGIKGYDWMEEDFILDEAKSPKES